MASGFVTETELEAKRAVRQEEWERVRKPEEPKEAPEEAYDTRSLFERLNEQKDKKEMDWQEEHKLKNQIRGLNDDEVDFLDKVDDYRTEWDRKRMIEEKRELEEYQQKQAELREKEMEERLKNERKVPELRKAGTSNKNSQMKLLAGAVKRKADPGKVLETKKPKEDDAISPVKDTTPTGTTNGHSKNDTTSTGSASAVLPERHLSTSSVGSTGSAGEMLPERQLSTSSGGLLGLGDYGSESDEDESD